jgi:transposase-like protein
VASKAAELTAVFDAIELGPGQRYWVHKNANVLNKLPKSQQPKAKRALQENYCTRGNLTAKKSADIEAVAVTIEWDMSPAFRHSGRNRSGRGQFILRCVI